MLHSAFSVVNGTMLRGFSFPNSSRMMGIQFVDATQKAALVNSFTPHILPLDYEAIRQSQKSFDLLAAYNPGLAVNLVVDGAPQHLTGAYVTDEFFRILGVTPVIGRDFTPADNRPGAEQVALIGYQHWQRDFGGSTAILDKAIQINGRSARIVGVMPAGVAFPLNEEIWIPYYTEFPPKARNDRTARGTAPGVLGLLKNGVTLAQAGAEISGIAKQLAADFPDTNKKFDSALVQPMIKDFFPQTIPGQLWTMLAFCTGILGIACFNVMNMQFARATLRAKELAIRSSLGATRARLVRQMLTESLLIAGLGALGGATLALWATDYLNAATHNSVNAIPAFMTFDLNAPVLGMVVLAAVVSAMISGFVPAWLASRTNAATALKETGRGNTGRSIILILRGLGVLQIVVTCVLLIGALLQAQAIVRQQKIDYGYDTAALLSARMGLMDGAYPTPAARKLFLDRLVHELRSNPEFEGVALTSRRQMVFAGTAKIEIDGQAYRTDDSDRPTVNVEQVTDGYFAALGAKQIEGRDFTLDDTDAKLPVAIVNAAFAQKHFGHESAIGRRFRTVSNNGQLFGPWRTIVGVVATVRMRGPYNQPDVSDDAGFYVPYYSTVFGSVSAAPVAPQFPTLVVRPRAGNAHAAATALQREVNKVDPNLPLYYVGTPRENQDTFIASTRIIGVMFSIFGGVAVVLAGAGLYGVMSFAVNQRTREFGIRKALGADNLGILALVLRQGGFQLAVGLALGLGLAIAASIVWADSIASALFETNPRDPFTYVAVSALLTVVAIVATLVPARRATRADPMEALRAE